MSDDVINIRVLFWHLQVKESGRLKISLNRYWLENWRDAIRKPAAVYAWEL